MHPTDRDLLKQALEALEHIQRCIGLGTATIHYGSSTWEQSDQAIAALRERLAQPKPTPAWWRDGLTATLMREGINKHRAKEIADGYWEAYLQIPGDEDD